MMEHSATLVVQVSAAQGAYPIERATVIVESDDEYDRLVPLSAETDRDGKTPPFVLPTPPRINSLSPNASEVAFATYRVFVNKEGYYPKLIRNLPMFEGIDTTLPVNLIPDTLYDAMRDGPKTNNDLDIRDPDSEEV